jgi:chemotaxis protein methyltransferase CheR
MSALDHRAGRVSDVELEQFCELVYRATGMRFGSRKRYFLDKRILERVRVTGKGSVAEYLQALRLEPRSAEMQAVVESMTINETYFFREEEQLDRVVRDVLPRLSAARAPGAPIRILSMPCSSGEEPYSVAIKLLEGWADVDRFDVHIFGTDIDSKMLERAREGRFSTRSVHRLSETILERYFREESPGAYRILEELRQSIEFRRVNVLERSAMRAYRDMDLILCRNLLIYFDEASRRKAVDALYEALRPGGVLVLGASESVGLSASLFEIERAQGAPIYRKPQRDRGQR